MTIQEVNALYPICELEKKRLLTSLTKPVQNLRPTRHLLIGNGSIFFYVENSTACSHDCFFVPYLCTKPSTALIVYQFIKTLFCILFVEQNKI